MSLALSDLRKIWSISIKSVGLNFHLQNVHLPFCIFNSVETSFLIPRCFGDSITPIILIPVMDLVSFWNENKIKPEKINDTQDIFQAQTTNFGSYLMYVP